MTADIETKVLTCLRQIHDLEEREIKREHHLVADLGMDSLDHIEFIMLLEEAFDVDIPDDAATSVQTVADAINFVAKFYPK